MKFSPLIAAVAGLATSVLAQTPPGYTWAQTNKTLFLKYPGFPVFKGGAVLPYAGKPSIPPPKRRIYLTTHDRAHVPASHLFFLPPQWHLHSLFRGCRRQQIGGGSSQAPLA